MVIWGMMVVGPGESGRFLNRSLACLKRLCDGSTLVLNNVDPSTRKACEASGFDIYDDNREWGINQPLIKTDLLQRIYEHHKPDWVVAIDADEEISSACTRTELESLASGEEVAHRFYVTNLMDDERHYSKTWSFWNVRFFKCDPSLGLTYERKALHCGLAPKWAYQYGWHAPFVLLHYGLMREEDRLRKASRYKQYDPTARFMDRSYYDRLATGFDSVLFDRVKIEIELKEELSKILRKRPALNMANKGKFYWVRRLRDGAILDIPEGNLDGTLKRGGFELIEEAQPLLAAASEVPLIRHTELHIDLAEPEAFEPKKKTRSKKL